MSRCRCDTLPIWDVPKDKKKPHPEDTAFFSLCKVGLLSGRSFNGSRSFFFLLALLGFLMFLILLNGFLHFFLLNLHFSGRAGSSSLSFGVCFDFSGTHNTC